MSHKNRVLRALTKPLRLELDRSAKTPLAEQIRKGIGAAIRTRWSHGSAPASWQDLAAQLGVARAPYAQRTKLSAASSSSLRARPERV